MTNMTKISAQQAKERLKGFDEFAAKTLEAWKTPGAAVAVIADGEVVHSAGYGLRDVAKNLPVTPETLFAIGSCTKAFTAFDLGLLVDEGKLAWNTPVQHKLPTFRLKDSVATATANAKDLLMHRTGLPRHDNAWYGSPHNREELMERLHTFQPSLGFREAFQYNNLMYMAAGYLAGHVGGSSWETLTKERIFDPLGMTHSNFSVHVSEKADNAAQPYLWTHDAATLVPFRDLDHIAPAGAINSNLIDMAPWLLMHLNGGVHNGKQIIKPETLKQMHAPHIAMPLPPESPWITYPVVQNTTYALGWAGQTYRGRTMVRHTGGIDGFITFVSFLPEEGVGTIIFTNVGLDLPAAALHCHVYDRLLDLDQPDWNERMKLHYAKLNEMGEKAKAGFIDTRKPDTQPAHPLADYAGEYEHAGYGKITVSVDGTRLVATFNGITYTGDHHHYEVFRLENEDREMLLPVMFTGGFGGEIAGVQIPLEPTVEPILFARIQKEPNDHVS